MFASPQSSKHKKGPPHDPAPASTHTSRCGKVGAVGGFHKSVQAYLQKSHTRSSIITHPFKPIKSQTSIQVYLQKSHIVTHPFKRNHTSVQAYQKSNIHSSLPSKVTHRHTSVQVYLQKSHIRSSLPSKVTHRHTSVQVYLQKSHIVTHPFKRTFKSHTSSHIRSSVPSKVTHRHTSVQVYLQKSHIVTHPFKRTFKSHTSSHIRSSVPGLGARSPPSAWFSCPHETSPSPC